MLRMHAHLHAYHLLLLKSGGKTLLVHFFADARFVGATVLVGFLEATVLVGFFELAVDFDFLEDLEEEDELEEEDDLEDLEEADFDLEEAKVLALLLGESWLHASATILKISFCGFPGLASRIALLCFFIKTW